MAHPQQQGDEFEEAFVRLLERVLRDELGYEDVEVARQSAGPQYGKDVRAAWTSPQTGRCRWAFECKSHAEGTLKPNAVADKLWAVAGSPQDIDVWCLAACHTEPNATLAELLAGQGYVRCDTAVLSRQSGRIDRLFALDATLYAEVYGSPAPTLDDAERGAIREETARFLDEHTRAGKRRRLQGWEIAGPGEVAVGQDDPLEAARYLKGLRGASWEAVAHRWAIERHTTSDLVRFVGDSIADTSSRWTWTRLVGAIGEGKSTVLRQLAWRAASEIDDLTVLFAEAEHRQVSVPATWIESLPAGSRLLLCVDGSARLRDFGDLERLAGGGRSIAAVVADRSYVRNRADARRRAPDIVLEALDADEQHALAQALVERDLVRGGVTVENARERIAGARGRASRGDASWLLPTVMELTDPEGRGFEDLLADALRRLEDVDTPGTLALLLAASLVHVAGDGLPDDLARDVVGSRELPAARHALDAELDEHFLGVRDTRPALTRSLVTHHRLLAQTFVAQARLVVGRALDDTASALGYAGRTRLDGDGIVELWLSRLYQDVVDAMTKADPPDPETAVALLQAWLDYDDLRFQNHQRLGDAITVWIQEELKRPGHDRQRIEDLADAARAAYAKSLQVAREVVTRPDRYPRPLTRVDLTISERRTFHAWSVLEGRVGAELGDRSASLRGVLLALRSFGPTTHDDPDRVAKTSGTLALKLIDLGLAELAAATIAACRAARGDPATIDEATRRLGPDATLPGGGGIDLLDEVLAALCLGPLEEEWEAIGWRERREEHIEELLRVLDGARSWLHRTEAVDAAAATLRARVA